METFRAWFSANFEHVLFALLLLTRVGDIWSTWLATPKLRLEGNLVARRLGWKFAFATLLVSFLPYYSTALAVAALPVFCLACWSNFCRVWMLRALGEERWAQLITEAASRTARPLAVLWFGLAHAFLALPGFLAMGLTEPTDWAFWIGLGFAAASAILFAHHTVFIVREIGRANRQASAAV